MIMPEDREVTLYAAHKLTVWASLSEENGALTIGGQDFSGAYLGSREYEYAMTVPAAEIPTVIRALGGQDGNDVLELLTRHGEEIVRQGELAWLRSLGLQPKFWSRHDDETSW